MWISEKKSLARISSVGLLCSLIAVSSLSSVAFATASPAPTVSATYPGVYSNNTAPASATIAASPTQEMELVNSSYTIMNRSGVGTSGPINALVGGSNVFLSDPQVIWDPSSNRFYFSLFENHGTSTPDEGIAWGFSKTATPKTASDFCSYFNAFNYGAASFPDRQSLGDTTNFLLFSSNRYSVSTEALLGSDTAWVAKPAAGKTTCPSAGSFKSGVQALKNPDGTAPYTPTSARQVDGSSTGWIVATPSYVSGNSLTLFTVTKNKTTGNAVISQPASVPVPAYSYPPSAPQAGKTLSGSPAPPLETRIYLTQAIAAYDPRVGHDALWTAHTIAGGAGSEARWYEINPGNHSLDQSGTVSDPNLYVFNATISPDRLVHGSTTAYGSNALINVSTSSSTTYPAIEMASTINGQPQSGLVMVQQSTGANIDFTCFEPATNTCRWGDYSGTTPDPGAALNGSTGGVWAANQWNVPDVNDSTPVWRTIIWRSLP